MEEDEKNDGTYLYKDGKKQMSSWEFFKKAGVVDSFEKNGYPLMPTHDYELLKIERLKLFEKAKISFLEEREMNKVPITEVETDVFYGAWLKHELEVIAQWLSDKYPNGDKKVKPSTSDQIEILKYQHFVNTELENMKPENKIKPIENFILKLNRMTIPDSVYDEFVKLDSYRSYSVSEGVTTYYGLNTPQIIGFPHVNCYILHEHYDNFQNKIRKGLLDGENKQVTFDNYFPLIEEYAKGFQKAYYEFETKVLPKAGLFEITNEQKAHSVYSKVIQFMSVTGMEFQFGPNGFDKVSNENMFNSGYSWGEKFKAWEIIFNNIPLFEPLFEKNKPKPKIKDEKEIESILLPEVDLTTQKEQIRLLHDLGILSFIKDRYPNSFKHSNNQLADLLGKILRINRTSVQPTLNALLNETSASRNYPSPTEKTKAIIDALNASEQN